MHPAVSSSAASAQLQVEETAYDSEDNNLTVYSAPDSSRKVRSRTLASQLRDPLEFEQGFYQDFIDTFKNFSATLELENKGSVARDHLANERTYLAWLRTALSLIAVGVGVTQLFRLSTTQDFYFTGKALGAALVILGLLFCFLGTYRYFQVQRWMTKDRYPATRGIAVLGTGMISAVIFALIVATLSGP